MKEDGSFRIEDLPPGPVQLLYSDGTRTVRLGTAGAPAKDLMLKLPPP